MNLKMFSLLFLCAGTLASTVPFNQRILYALENTESLFEDFVLTHDKHYVDEAEKTLRYEIFKENLRDINEKNTDPDENAEFGITFYSDLTSDEYIKMYTGFIPSKAANDLLINVTEPEIVDMDDRFDWRDKGAVTGVKNQKKCGSCWAFSTVGVVEGAYAIKHKKLQAFSEQQLVDCDTRDNGCQGGRMSDAVLYLMKSGGLESETSYPYKAVKGKCQAQSSKRIAKVEKFIMLNMQSEEFLRRNLVSIGPIAIAVDPTGFQHYKKGIVMKCPGRSLGHAVLLVGYGTENGVPYWSIKNSDGVSFGEQGYIRLKRGIDACGLLNSEAVAVEVA